MPSAAWNKLTIFKGDKQMKMTKQHYEFLTDEVLPLMASPSSIEEIADKLESTNDLFNRTVFLARALGKWEERNIPEQMVKDMNQLIREVTS